MKGDILRASKDKLSNNLLGPRCARFGVGGDNYIIVSELEVVPERGIHMMIVQLARLLRRSEFCSHFLPIDLVKTGPVRNLA